MTGPDGQDFAEFDAALERRLACKASHHEVGGLAARVAALERWRAATDAVAASRRWAAPIVISAIGLVATLVSLAALLINYK